MPFFSKFGGGSSRVFGFAKSSKAKVQVEYLVIAGGGGGALAGGGGGPGGGGAGGYRNSTSGETSGGGASAETAASLTFGETYTITVGGGGAQAVDCDALGGTGVNSSIVGDGVNIVSLGGGGGHVYFATLAQSAGGSAGGTCSFVDNSKPSTRAPGTAGQGYDGGLPNNVSPGGGGGGGGAGGLGGSGGEAVGGAGGAGLSSSITGTATTRGGGGGGGVMWFGQTLQGTRGSATAGGGYGGRQEEAGQSGTANTGGGGGAGGNDAQPCGAGASGNGGSGIVVVRWANTLPAATSTTGAGVSYQNVGGFHTYSFNATGTITP